MITGSGCEVLNSRLVNSSGRHSCVCVCVWHIRVCDIQYLVPVFSILFYHMYSQSIWVKLRPHCTKYTSCKHSGGGGAMFLFNSVCVPYLWTGWSNSLGLWHCASEFKIVTLVSEVWLCLVMNLRILTSHCLSMQREE